MVLLLLPSEEEFQIYFEIIRSLRGCLARSAQTEMDVMGGYSLPSIDTPQRFQKIPAASFRQQK